MLNLFTILAITVTLTQYNSILDSVYNNIVVYLGTSVTKSSLDEFLKGYVQIGNGGNGSNGGNSGSGNSSTCSWVGHCQGAICTTDNDCSDVLTCVSGVCGGNGNGGTSNSGSGNNSGNGNSGNGSNSCSWVGHCAGSTCTTDNDCSDVLTCVSGICGGSGNSGNSGNGSNGSNGNTGNSGNGNSGNSNSCSWPGHCQGAICTTDNDCSDVLTCVSGVCGGSSNSGTGNGNSGNTGNGSSNSSCSWPGHCIGSTCTTDNDCSDVLTCVSGVCGGSGSSGSGSNGNGSSGNGSNGNSGNGNGSSGNGGIPITSGSSGTLTVFNDDTTACYGSNIPSGNTCAINPLMLGISASTYTSLYANADPSQIPWCGKTITVNVSGKVFSCLVSDTCDPVGNPFVSNGNIIGGKCDFETVIDLYTGGNSQGLQFINSINGDDFYQGPMQWSIS